MRHSSYSQERKENNRQESRVDDVKLEKLKIYVLIKLFLIAVILGVLWLKYHSHRTAMILFATLHPR